MQFRAKALSKAREPDELDRPVVLVDPRTWTAVIVAFICVVGAGYWAAVGDLRTTIAAEGFLTTAGGTSAIPTSVRGQVSSMLVRQGETVAAGVPVAVVATGDAPAARTSVTAPFPGRVISVDVSVGTEVDRGQSVVTIERTTPNATPVAYVFVPPEQADRVRPGTAVTLSVAGIPQEAFGLARGRVASVSPYAVGPAGVAALVGGPINSQRFPDAARNKVIRVDLETSADTASGFAWTSAEGPPMRLTTQRTVSASFDLGSRSPYDVLLGGS